MPEAPEMEIYKNYLNKSVKGKGIREVNVLRAKSINMASEAFGNLIRGKQIQDVSRKGKFLIFKIADDHFLLTHMMLDGRLYFLTAENIQDLSLTEVMQRDAEGLKQCIKELPGKASVVLGLSDGSVLIFCSLTLGYLHCLSQEQVDKRLQELGRDPLDPNFQAEDFVQLLAGKRGTIKPWLMNPKNMAGIGNAYSNEALFRAGILPTRTIPSLSNEEKVGLHSSLVTVLKDSIRQGGDMEERFSPEDEFSGGYNKYFQAYDRAAKPCLVCHEPIQTIEVGGRKAYFCPHCQK